MDVSSFTKSILRTILFYKPVNAILRPFFRMLYPVFKKYINKIPVTKTIKVELTNDKKIYLCNADGADTIASMIYWEGLKSFEKAEIELFMKLLQVSQTVIDIGANTGLYALIAGINKKQVYAFEPVPMIYDRLCQNVCYNNLSNVILESKAVGDHNGSVTMYLPDSLLIPTSSSTLKGFRVSNRQLVVSSTTLDTYISTNMIPAVDLIKIDVEATEDKVLLGATTVIKRDNPLILCEVLHNRCEKVLNKVFEDTDYRFFMITNSELISKEKIEGDNMHPNYLFIPAARIKDCDSINIFDDQIAS